MPRLKFLFPIIIMSVIVTIIIATMTTYSAFTDSTSNQVNNFNTADIFLATNTSLPIITGALYQNELLSTSNGIWNGTVDTYSYQWQRCDSSGINCTDINLATNNTYNLVVDDVGNTIRVKVIANNLMGSSIAYSAVSNIIQAPLLSPPVNIILPVLSGDTSYLSVLSGSNGTWTGDEPITYSYQWQRCDSLGEDCIDILAATSSTYTLGINDIDMTVRLKVTASNSAGNVNAYSLVSDIILGPPQNTTVPSISPDILYTDYRVNSTATGNSGVWTGYNPINYDYQWQRCDTSGNNCNDISSANSTGYTIQVADMGYIIRLKVTATNSLGSNIAYSNLSTTVVGMPVNTNLPTVSGSTSYPSTLTANNGTWLGTDPITYSYQWQRCDITGSNCVDINNATGGNYITQDNDVDSTLRVKVTAYNAFGSTEATSAVSSIITGWVNKTSMSNARSQFGFATLDNSEILVAGGAGSSGYLSLAEKYNLNTNSWSSAGTLSVPRLNGSNSIILPKLADGKILFAGGLSTSNNIIASTDIYNPSTNSWSATGSMANPRRETNAVALPDGRVLIAGGYTTSLVPISSTEIYNPNTGTWSSTTPLNTARAGVVNIVLADGRVLAIGGTGSSGTLSSAEVYDPQTTQWTNTGAMPGALTQASAVRLSDGKILVTGGRITFDSTASSAAYLYNPSTNTWSNATSLSQARASSSLVLMSNGNVMLTGFRGDDSTLPEIYNPTTNTWTNYDNLNSPRAYHGSIILPQNGNIFMLGGYINATGTKTNTTESHSQTVTVPTINQSPELIYSSTTKIAVSTGSWNGAPNSYSYQWQRCDATGSNCNDLSGATFSYKDLTTADEGNTLKVKVTATNSAGQNTVTIGVSSIIGGYREKINNQSSAYWRMDESSGTTMVDSIGLYNGTYSGATVNQAAIYGKGTLFGGNPANASVPNIPIANSSSYTIEAKIKPAVLPGASQASYIAFKGNGATVAFEGFALAIYNGQYEFVMSNPDTIGQKYIMGGTATVGQWATVTGTFDRSSSVMRLYVDGKLVASGSFNSDMKLAATPMYVGRSGYTAGTGEGWLNGTIDELSLTNRALSIGEVVDRHMAATSGWVENTITPSISGTVQSGQTLTTNTGSWYSANSITYSYQWQSRNAGETWVNISSATNSTLALTDSLIGKEIRVNITGTAGAYSKTINTSAIGPVMPSGASIRLWLSADDLAVGDNQPVSNWTDRSSYANNVSVTSSDTTRRPLLDSDGINGHPTVVWDGINDSLISSKNMDGGNESFTIFAVTKPNTKRGSVVTWGNRATNDQVGLLVENNGTGQGGSQDLGVSTYVWGQDYSVRPMAPYNWNNKAMVLTGWGQAGASCGTRVNAGQAEKIYSSCPAKSTTVTPLNIGSNVLPLTGVNDYFEGSISEVIVFDSALNQAQRTSIEDYLGNKYGILAPTNTTAPAITGTANTGQTLTVNNGTWANAPTSYTYQWQKCDSSGNNCTNINNATSSSLYITGDLRTYTIKAKVTAINEYGQNTIISTQTSVITSTSSYETKILNDGPDAYWRIDETSGTTMKALIGPDGTYVGSDLGLGTTSVSNLLGTAMKSASRSGGSTATLTGTDSRDETLELWFNMPSTSTYGLLASVGGLGVGIAQWWGDYGVPSNQLQISVPGGGWGWVGGNVTTGWHHIALRIASDGTQTLFLDGEQVTITSYAGIAYTGGEVKIAKDNSRAFDGTIDEVAFYKRQLTTTEIRDHYLAVTAPMNNFNLTTYRNEVMADSPWANWRMDTQPSAASCGVSQAACAPDSSGNGRHGHVFLSAADQTGIISGSNSLYVPRFYVPSAPSSVGITFEAWIKPDQLSSGTPETIMNLGDQAGGVGIYTVNSSLNANGNCIWAVHYTAGGGFNSSNCGSIKASVWQHLVVTIDKTSSTKVYVNGSLVSSAGSGNYILKNLISVGYTPDNISDAVGTAHYGFMGYMDETAVYSGVLSAARIKAHYRAGQ